MEKNKIRNKEAEKETVKIRKKENRILILCANERYRSKTKQDKSG